MQTFPANYGYIITSAREQGTTCPIGVIDDKGDYKQACADAQDGVAMAIYPNKDAANEAIKRAAGDTDPLVFDGLRVVSLRHTKNHRAIECAIYGYVTYPAGKPAKTDYQSRRFCD